MISSYHSFKEVPKTGVIYVMTEAEKRGFSKNRKLWANLGQGAPEIGDLDGAPERLKVINLDLNSYEYAPVGGTQKLKEAVAKLYNDRYRKNKSTKYSAENVAIGSGGRLALTRVVSTLGPSHIGHFLPDYTAYEELLGSFGTFVPIPISLSPEENYTFNIENLKKEILGKGLSTILISNPGNPTGQTIKGNNLKSWIKLCSELECVSIFDEFYSHYVYDKETASISAAEYVEDVNKDPIIILDGLTKNWRYPGLRISWTVAPKKIIEGITSAGSFLDGGAPHAIQNAVIPMINKKHADQEALSIKKHFTKKAQYMAESLAELGIKTKQPDGSFYCWGELSGLPKNLRSGFNLFNACIENNVIIVPGIFFDINPGKRRPKNLSTFENYARFSFGPPLEELKLGIKKLKEVIFNT